MRAGRYAYQDRAARKRQRFALGADAPPMAWLGLLPTDDAYPLTSSATYRVTASVSKNFTKKQIGDYLASHGWVNILLWDESVPGEAPLPTDWPSGQEELGGLEDNHRWLRGEATRTSDTSIDVVSTVHAIFTIRLSVYRIANAWRKAPAPTTGLDTPPILIGPGLGPLGLDVGIPQPIGASVYYAWRDSNDPHELRELAATMRQGSFPIAASVLDQEALAVEGQQQAAADKKEKSSSTLAKVGLAATIGLGVLGLLKKS